MLLRGLGNEFSTLRRKVVRSSSGLSSPAFKHCFFQKNLAKEHSTEVFGGDEFTR